MRPRASRINLSTDNGDDGEDVESTVLHDICPPIEDGADPFTGCFAPEAALSTLDGEAAAGSWSLHLVDDAGGDTGTLNGWTLQICSAP